MSKDIVFVDGSENVFADIGVRDPEGSRVRADLALQIAQLIKKRGLRQTDVAEILGVDQAKVSKLVRGRISGFTSDRLFRYLEALGCNVRIVLKENRSLRARGKTKVLGV
jgi:predicted XRE-type DNA-binding protein